MRGLLAVVFCILSAGASAELLRVGTLNTESASDTQPYKVAETIREIGFTDIWAFQEVASREAAIEFTVAAGAVGSRKSFRYVVSESGEIASQHRKNDLLAIVYNSSRFRQVETVELHGIRSDPSSGRLGKANWRLRGALFIRLLDKDTDREFYVGNVHLKCCGGNGPDIRHHQAEIIREWVERQDVPVILTGDFNIPVAPSSSDGNQNSDAFTTLEQSMVWIRPGNPVKTQCSPSFNSMLDHYFLKTGPGISNGEVMIGMTSASYCDGDDKGYADHRPVIGLFDVTQ